MNSLPRGTWWWVPNPQKRVVYLQEVRGKGEEGEREFAHSLKKKQELVDSLAYSSTPWLQKTVFH
jgi:hypothetical protein